MYIHKYWQQGTMHGKFSYMISQTYTGLHRIMYITFNKINKTMPTWLSNCAGTIWPVKITYDMYIHKY